MRRALVQQIDRRRAVRTRTLIPLALLALSGCPEPHVAAAGSIEVTVRDPSTGAAMESAPVTVLGTALSAVTSASGVAVLAQVATGLQTVRVQLAGSCVNDRPVTVEEATVARMTIWNCGDAVELRNALGDAAIAVVDLRSVVGGSTQCLADELLQGTGVLSIPMNALPLDSCHGSVAVLTRDHALYFTRDASAFAWTDGLGDVMPINLAPKRLIVPITFMVSPDPAGDYGDGETLANDQLLLAQDILSSELTGLELAGSETGAPIVIRRTSALAATVVGKSCASVAAIRADPTLYSPGRLNVFVVSQIVDGFGALAGGLSCSVEQAPDIIFIAPGAAKAHTLMHEIGHALGLQRPIWGHTEGLQGFWYAAATEPLNLMDTGRTLEGMYLSVGQVLRMTLSDDSWLNRPSASDGTTLRQRQSTGVVVPVSFPCGCPEIASTDDCAPLNRDILRSGTVTTSSSETVACGVNAVPPKAIACGSSLNVDVMIELLPLHAVGGARFFSLDPAIVRVNPGPDDSKHGILVPVANGTGRIRVYADGSPHTFPVTVSGCP